MTTDTPDPVPRCGGGVEAMTRMGSNHDFPSPSPGTVASAVASAKAQAKVAYTRAKVIRLGLTQAQMGALIGVPGFRLSAADLPTLLRIAARATAMKETP